MAQPVTSPSIEALIEGGVSGQVAVGNQNVQIHADHGAVVFFTPPGTQPMPRLRSLPVFQRPRPVRGLVDRQADISSALAAIGTSLPVGIHGAPGIGKSTLLRHLAYAVESGALPDGVLHLSARQQPAEDLLQSLFDAFYTCDVPYKPTAVQARQLLQSRKALILLDDTDLGREATEELLDSAPSCAFVLATRERCLWGECQSIGLGGLPLEDARALFERELRRSLTAEEASAFESLYARLEGHPLRLLQAVAQVREGRPFADPTLIDEGSLRQALATLPADEKRLLSALAAVGGGPVGTAHLAALADVADPIPVLDALWWRSLVQTHSPRYSLAGNLPDVLPKTLDLTPWRERALGYFIAWAEARRGEPAALLEEIGVLRALLDWAAETGHHAEAQRLGRVLDTALAVTGRWGAWKQTLERVRGAAGALGDRTTQGWALHQLGTRLLCLDDKAAARPLLEEALAIREALGDRAGAAVTRHNLGLLGVLPSSEPSSGKGPRSALRLLPWVGGVLLVLVVVAIGLLRPWSDKQDDNGETVVSSSDMESPLDETETSPSTEGPTDSTTDVTVTTPPDTTDQSSDGTPDDDETPGTLRLEIPRRLEFPVLLVESPSSFGAETISISNTGTLPLRVAGVSFTENSGDAFSWKSDCGRSPVPAGGQCSIRIFFQPPKAASYHAVLAVAVEGLGPQTVELSGVAKEPPPRGWCCANGNVLSASQDECAGRNGKLFEKRDEAASACHKGWCCADGNVSAGSLAECKSRQGMFFEDRDQATNACRQGWCCADGKVFNAYAYECGNRGGKLFADRAQAADACQQGFCCAGGGVFSASRADCKGRQGLFSEDQGRAADACRKGSCCADGKVFDAYAYECGNRGGKLFADRAQAADACQQGFCCAGGNVSAESLADCTARKGMFFEDQGRAANACRQGWCCADGNVFPGSMADCKERRGRFYGDPNQATSACREGWCCVNGKVFRSSQEDCNGYGGKLFDDEKQAAIACQPPKEVWCCLPGGEPFQTSREKCQDLKGSQYFESKDEAVRKCQQIK